jgi:hypothetical protein
MLARTNRGDPAELADLKSACGGSSHCVLDYWCTSCLLCICMACSWRQRAREHEEGVTGSDKQVCQGGGKTMWPVARRRFVLFR